MNDEQKKLLIDKVIDYFGVEDAEFVLTNYPLTGPSGLRRMMGEIYPEYFCRAYLAELFDKEFGDYAKEILDELTRSIESESAEKIAVIAPRGHGKSTLSSVAIPAWAALYNKKKFTYFISANGDTAANFLDKVKKALESPEIFQDFGKQKGRVWNADFINLANGAWIGCTGWKSGIRGINKDRRPDLIICHKKGTLMSHNNEWISVEQHPSFKGSYMTEGISVDIFGVPFMETVTKEHKYWTRKILPKHTNVKINGLVYEGWTEAQCLTKNHYIGYKIDYEVTLPQAIKYYSPGTIIKRDSKGRIISTANDFKDKVPNEFYDAEWWWFFGLWWGDGHLAGKYQVAITINNKDDYVRDRLINLLNKYKIAFTRVEKIGCFQIVFSHAAFNKWLKTWKHGNSMKIPPSWVEKIETNYQKNLIHGYIDADGFIDYKNNAVRLTSIYLPGLLCVKRILARIGIASTIRHGKEEHSEVFPNGQRCIAQKKYDLRFRRDASLLGYEIRNPERYAFDKVFISDGFLWSKVFETHISEKTEFCPISTEDRTYHTHFGMSHNCDDLEDKSTIESDSLRAKLEIAFNEEIGRLGDYDTDMFYIGTLLSTDALLARVIEMPSWKTIFYKRVLSFPDEIGEKLWEEWRAIYRDIGNTQRMEDAYAFYLEHKEEMIRGVRVLWEGKTPEDKMLYKGAYYNVMLDREAFGEDAFYKEDQNEPRNAKDKPFNKLTYWDSWPEQIIKLKLACDPSEGKGDSSAYVVGGEYNGGIFVKDGKLAMHNPYQIMDEIIRFIKEYPAIDEIVLESNLFKDLLKTELIKKLCDADCYRMVTYKPATDNKEIRIMKMEPDITGGKILFNSLNVAFNEEVKDFSIKPKCKHDDAPDSLAMLHRNLKTPNYFMA